MAIYLFATILFVGCVKEQTKNSTTEDIELNNEISILGEEIGLNVEAKVLNISYGNNTEINNFIKILKSTTTHEWNIDNSTTLKFITSIGDTLTSISVPLLSTPNTMVCIVEINGQTNTYVLDLIFDDNGKTMSYRINNDIDFIELKSTNGWMDCMQGVLGSHVGVIIAVGGVAGGLGCTACSGVAGFFMGVAVLACVLSVTL